MEKHTFLIAFVVAMTCALTGCRVNNGDIGPLYGTWAVTEVTVDGEVYDGWLFDDWTGTFFEFQNNICFVSRTTDRYDLEYRVCTWEWIETDKEIALDFTHFDDRFPVPTPGGYLYGAPEWLLLTQPAVYHFTVQWDGKRHFVWTTVNTEGQTLTYTMKKTY